MKNATAEIQREIEKGATEVQKNINIEEEVKSIKDAAKSFQKRIEDASNESIADKKPTDGENEPENPLAPPDAVKR